MKGYKGFDKDLKCRGMRYAIGETFTYSGTLSLCDSGLHFVEHPLDALTYYAPSSNRYAEVEAEGVSDQTEINSKRVAKSLRLTAELNIPALVKAAVAFVFEKKGFTTGISAFSMMTLPPSAAHSATTGNSAHSATTGYYSHSATTGNSAHSATTGNSAHSATTGCSAHSATTGNYAHSATTGDYSHSGTTGYSAHSVTTGNSAHSATTSDSAHSAATGNAAHSATTGDYSHAAATGDGSRAAATGNYSHAAATGYSSRAAAAGKESISASLGRNGSAKGSIGGWLVLSEIDDCLKIKAIGVARVDGKKIKADTFYQIKNGKFVEVQ